MREIDQKCINAIRMLGVDAINKAKSGHPGIVLGAAPMIYTLFSRHLRVSAENPKWFNRDRFILSAGHGSAMLYAMLHLAGFDIDVEDLKEFRQLGSLTPGHPEYNHTPGVDATTGPLGQGISMIAGMALAEEFLAAKYNKDGLNVVDHYSYAICGDGDLQEGVTQEAMSLAGHLGLGKMIVLYDSNDIQLDGAVTNANSENVKQKYESMNWQYLYVADGNDIDAIDKAIIEAKKEKSKPTIIEIKTVIGFGAPTQGTNKVHGAPIGEADANELRKSLNWEYEPFVVPQDVYQECSEKIWARGIHEEKLWGLLVEEYIEKNQEIGNEFLDLVNDRFDIDFSKLSSYEIGTNEATRATSGKVIAELSNLCQTFIGGSADLTASTKAKGADGNFTKENRLGRNINYGVRENAMGSIANGITLHGGIKTFTGAFFVFSDYMKPALRMASLMSIPTIFVFSHDTIAVGEDGPTHEPIEQMVGIRAIPNMNVMRPCDANEVKYSWMYAMKSKTMPTTILLTRQNLEVMKETSYENVSKGGYVISPEKGNLDGVLIAAGSEVGLAIKAQEELEKEGIHTRVVSMVSTNLFDLQDKKYQETVLPKGVKKLAIEMGSTIGWYKYADDVMGIDTFGTSAPITKIIPHYGFTVENVVKRFKNSL